MSAAYGYGFGGCGLGVLVDGLAEALHKGGACRAELAAGDEQFRLSALQRSASPALSILPQEGFSPVGVRSNGRLTARGCRTS